jgi:regulator of protease activity HflC (stomatin/prohibitin superfamily)
MGNIGLVSVPHQHIYVVELFGKYHRNLTPGLNLIIPFVQRVSNRLII